MSIEGYVKALEIICEELKGRAPEIIGNGKHLLHSVDLRIHIAVNECPSYDVSCSYYPRKIEVVGE